MPLLPVLIALLLLIFAGAGLFVVLLDVRRARREMEVRVELVTRRGRTPAGPDAPQSDLPISGGRSQLAMWLRHWFAIGLPHTWGMRRLAFAAHQPALFHGHRRGCYIRGVLPRPADVAQT
jgi:hypothetical protein